MNLTVKIWRQQSAAAQGQFVSYQVKDITPDMSFLEMLDDRVDIRGQIPVTLGKDGPPWTPAVTSQVKGDSSKSSLGEISPNVNIAP